MTELIRQFLYAAVRRTAHRRALFQQRLRDIIRDRNWEDYASYDDIVEELELVHIKEIRVVIDPRLLV